MKTVIVTGASGGLGLSISLRLIEKGYDVFGISRNTQNLNFPSHNCDISDFNSLKNCSKHIKKRYGKIDALINVAGIASMNLALMTPKHITEDLIHTNLVGTIYSCQLFSPLLIRNQSGRIINFSTIAVILGLKGESIYAASKAGVEGFSRAFAREMADFNVTVNCIAPGPIKTNLMKGVTDNQIRNIVNNQIIQKIYKPNDVADLVELLLDKKANMITGQVMHVGGA